MPLLPGLGYAAFGARAEAARLAGALTSEPSTRFPTQRACLAGVEVEARFVAALQMVARHETRGDTMQLFRDDEMLLGFEAVHF